MTAPRDDGESTPDLDDRERESALHLARQIARPDLESSRAPGPGEKLDERFAIVRELGKGGYGRVFEALDVELGRPVAIKLVGRPGPALLGGRRWEAFEREARATARLHHANVVTIHDWGRWNGAPYLVLELLHGEPLAHRLRRGPLPMREALKTAIAIARALAHAHAAGVLHLDLSARNVFLTTGGEVKVLDFGLALVDRDSGEAAAGGTRAYAAPEQARGDAVDARADLWALGVLLFQMLTGALPAGGTEHAIADSDVAAVVERALAVDRASRFASAEEMLAALLRPGGEELSPYRFLEPFTEAEAACFFGREREVARLEGMLSSRPLVAVLGPTGAGKTSLLLAGLVPRLRRSPKPPLIVALRPGSDPLRLLREKLPPIDDAVENLGERLREHARRSGTRVVLVIDQLEELYTQLEDRAARAEIVEVLLTAAADALGDVRVVVALRDDFLSRMGETRELRDRIVAGSLYLDPPEAADLEHALRDPARVRGYELEEGLVAQMLAEVKGETTPLPSLQLAASRLWEMRDREARLLRKEALARLGGVVGVLAEHADRILGALDGDEQRDVALEMFRRLVSPPGTRRLLERDALLALSPAAPAVLERLLGGRLVVARSHAGRAGVELAHESLVLSWDRLRLLLLEEREDTRLRERLSRAAAVWHEEGRPASLLWRGKVLQGGQRLRKETLSPPETAFLSAAEARARRWRRTAVASIAGGLAVALGATAISMVSMRASERRAAEARARAIVSEASAAGDPLVAALLVEELGEAPVPGTADVVRKLSTQSIPLAVLRGHKARVYGVAVSADGGRLLSASEDGTVRVWTLAGAAGPPLVVPGEHMHTLARPFTPDGRRFAIEVNGAVRLAGVDGSVQALFRVVGPARDIELSPDGTRLARSGGDGSLAAWQLEGEREPLVLEGGTSGELAGPIAFSPDGARLARGDRNGVLRIWSVDREGEVIVLGGHTGEIERVAFSPDGTLIATASYDATVRIWNVAGGAPSRVLSGHTSAVNDVAFSPDGARLLTASEDGTSRVWSVAGDQIAVDEGTGAAARRARFSPDGTQALVTFGSGLARAWRPDAPGLAVSLGGGSVRIVDAVYTPDGTRIAAGCEDGSIRIFSAAPPREGLVLAEPTDRIWVARFAARGDRLITGSAAGVVRLRSFDGAPLETFRLPRSAWGVDVSPDGARAAIADISCSAWLWDLGRGKPRALAEGARGGSAAHGDLTFSRDGERFALGCADGVRVWSVAGGAPILLATPAGAKDSAFSPDGRRVAAAGVDHAVTLWELARPDAPQRLLGHQDMVLDVDFSPDGHDLVSASVDRTARVWRVDGAPLLVLHHDSVVLTARYSHDGRRIVTASTDGVVRTWDAADGSELEVRRLSAGALGSAAFSADGSRIAAGALDGTLHLWRTGDADRAEIAIGHSAAIDRVEFSPDGERVLTIADDGTARLWTTDLSLLRARLRHATTACLLPEQRVNLLGESPEEAQRRAELCPSLR